MVRKGSRGAVVGAVIADVAVAGIVLMVGMDARRPADEVREAGRLLAKGDAAAAAQRLRGVLAEGPWSTAREADVRHLLGRALVAAGDRKGAVDEWLAVLRLDAAAPPEPLMGPDEFEAAAEAALAELPQDLLDRLGNVAVLVADQPSPEMVAGGLDPRVLGLYHGVPLAKRSVSFGAPYADTIHLFRLNLERVCGSRAELAARIRLVVLHETAHFFGYSEAQLRAMGLA